MPARARAYWKGYLRLSLVSIAVELYAATASSNNLAMHQIHKPSGKRVRYEKVVPGLGPVDSSDIVKGFEVEDDTYVILELDEIDAIKLESKHTIELVQFVDHCEVDPRYFERPYYLVPEGDVSTEGYSVIRSALEQAKKVGIGQMAMRGRESLVAIKPCGRGLLLETLRNADEVRTTDAYFDDIPDTKLDKDMVGLAQELIARKAKPFNPLVFKDHYDDALRALIEEKRRGHAIVTTGEEPRPRAPGKVIDLIEALKKSVANDAGKKVSSARRAPASRPTRSTTARKPKPSKRRA